MTASAKTFFKIMLGTTAAAVLVIYLMMYQQNIAVVLGGCGMALICYFIMSINLPPLFHLLAERANSIMAIYPDVSGNALHIFSEFTQSRFKTGQSPLRNIQYYLLIPDTKKLYYTVLFTHSMRSLSGSSGYEGYSSFEEDVLGSEDYKAALEKYSIKAGWPLRLGKESREGEDEAYETKLGIYTFRVEKKTEMIQDTLRICSYDEAGKLLWRKKI